MIARMTTGWLTGHRIRTAQKPVRCDFWTNAAQCPHTIQPGERYVDGTLNDTPGWGADRICAHHAGLFDPAYGGAGHLPSPSETRDPTNEIPG